ncbi:unnamed protein product [Fraxinus pennsylvanica]|uniref:Uncharacterized protein n=1 Tax=Fraxinus pennsylvanica TaxID=56036 RepID=A0AAD2DNG4_9LAMI|nr:unnamed protein product [Fraxinus pennsylvanica]
MCDRILTRVDAIYKKYDKYDIEKQKDSNIAGDDAFARLYAALEFDIEAALQKSRTSALVINAEIRRKKARLLDEVPKLQRLAVKKKELSVSQLMTGLIETVIILQTLLPSLGTLLSSFWALAIQLYFQVLMTNNQNPLTMSELFHPLEK